MTNKELAKILLLGIGVAFVAVVVEPIDIVAADVLYTISGTVTLIFGIWIAMRNINGEDKKDK